MASPVPHVICHNLEHFSWESALRFDSLVGPHLRASDVCGWKGHAWIIHFNLHLGFQIKSDAWHELASASCPHARWEICPFLIQFWIKIITALSRDFFFWKQYSLVKIEWMASINHAILNRSDITLSQTNLALPWITWPDSVIHSLLVNKFVVRAFLQSVQTMPERGHFNHFFVNLSGPPPTMNIFIK